MDLFDQLAGLFYWIIGPIIVGTLLLPFTPYLVKKILYPEKKPFPSIVPFWGTLVFCVLVFSWIWTMYFNGRFFYEWDAGFTQYSLVSYESPLLDGSGTWLAKGWQEWHLYLLWIGISMVIYTIGIIVSFSMNRKKENFSYYRKVILISSLLMFTLGLIIAPFFGHFR